MILALFCLLIGAISGIVAGGRVRNLTDVQVRWAFVPWGWLFAAVFANRIGGNLGFGLHLAGLACLAVFAVVNTKHVSGMWLVMLGATLNLLMTANNHGMPYSLHALRQAGVQPANYTDVPKLTVGSHPQRSGDQLVFLGDIVPIPPLNTVVSVGDLMVGLGFAVVAANALTGRRREGRRVNGVYTARHLAMATDSNNARSLLKVQTMPTLPVSAMSTEQIANADTSGAVTSDRSLFEDVTTVDAADHITVDADGFAAVGIDDPFGRLSTEERHRARERAVWNTRVQLLKATGDPSVLIDLTGASSIEPVDVTALHAVAQALLKSDGQSSAAMNVDDVRRLLTDAVNVNAVTSSDSLAKSANGRLVEAPLTHVIDLTAPDQQIETEPTLAHVIDLTTSSPPIETEQTLINLSQLDPEVDPVSSMRTGSNNRSEGAS